MFCPKVSDIPLGGEEVHLLNAILSLMLIWARKRPCARANIVGPRGSAPSLARSRMETRRRTRRPARSGHFESPPSQLDCILASPLVSAAQERFEVRPLAPPDTSPPHVVGLPRLSIRPAVSRLQLRGTMLRLYLASLLERGPVRFDDEMRLVLMFALSGLVVSLFLAAKIRAISDALVGISIGF
jgi:hypothetical protein